MTEHEPIPVPVTIDRSTRIPLGIASALLVGAMSLGLVLIGWISTMIWQGSQVWLRLEAQVESQGRDIEAIKVELQGATSSRWTSEDMRRWVELFQATNPDSPFLIPDAW